MTHTPAPFLKLNFQKFIIHEKLYNYTILIKHNLKFKHTKWLEVRKLSNVILISTAYILGNEYTYKGREK